MRVISLVTPNRVTACRVFLGAASIAIYASCGRGEAPIGGYVAMTLTMAAIALDGVDGWIARRRRLASPIGAKLDVLGDRVLENLYFVFFAVSGQLPVWVPVIFFVRGAVTDFLRGITANSGIDGRYEKGDGTLGKNWMLQSKAGIALVASRFSRGAYAVMKCACFCALGAEWTLLRAENVSKGVLGATHGVVTGLVAATTAFCLLRAAPVMWEGRKYFGAPRKVGEEMRSGDAARAAKESAGEMRGFAAAR